MLDLRWVMGMRKSGQVHNQNLYFMSVCSLYTNQATAFSTLEVFHRGRVPSEVIEIQPY